MVINLDNFRADTDAIIDDWAETCIIAQLNTMYDKGGFTSINKFTTIPYIIFDDFADNKFEDRDFLNYPEWLIYDGSWTASNGYLEKTATQDVWENIYIADTNFDNIVWEFSVTLQANSWDNEISVTLSDKPSIAIGGDAANGYNFWIAGPADLTLFRIDAVPIQSISIINSAWTADTNKHIFKIIRQTGGLWEVFIDGNSIGTATDNTYTSTTYFTFRSWGVNDIIDDIRVYRYSNIWPNNKVILDFQPLTSSDRYIIKEMGMNAVNMFAVYSPTTITIKDDDYIFRYTETGDMGDGTGSLNTLTDSTKTWVTNEWEGFQLIDNVGDFYEITDNDATSVTVVGTPIDGTYYIAESYIVRNIEKNEDHYRILVEHQSKEH